MFRFEKAATQGNQYASYRLGKLYLLGDGAPKNTEKAIEYLTQAAESGNQYAQYALGKLYLDRQDVEQAHYWFTQSATQGNEYAQFFLDRWDNLKPPSVMLSVTQLLHHISEFFQDNSIPPQAPSCCDRMGFVRASCSVSSSRSKSCFSQLATRATAFSISEPGVICCSLGVMLP